MAEYGKVENPTLNVKDYKMGDFVHWLMHDTQPSFAVVTGTNGDNVQLRHFEGGFPFELSKTPKYGSMRKASRDESLAHFHQISKMFEKEFEAGGLSGALSARRQHYINGIISQLEEDGRNTFYAATIDPQDPMTGTYVLMGIYSGQGPSEHLEGLVVVPRLSEGTVSRVVKDTNPNGFGKIPSDVYNTPATSHGSLVAYWTYEVPEKALGLVESPKKLELRLD
ncbi:TPA: hypothetical protein HA239_03760 [Candidatus Woesearchaeota archaeon]|nr:hypothetical protein QT06_C0001G0831 [archaeon GW2011_AR15]MBS3103390.1 hypothetical protein [Candidatus Woesearchaeota archaeon]HIH41507.1 hypothetical protein [Candidatus Woesearchaeota archaeon]